MHSKDCHEVFSSIKVIKKKDTDDQYWTTISTLYRNFRLRALREAGPNAQGGWTLALESKRSMDSYMKEVTDPRYWIYLCVRQSCSCGVKPIESDTEKLLAGEWVGMTTLYGPLSMDEWCLPTQRPKNFEGPEQFYHSGGTYFVPQYRQIQDEGKTPLAAKLLLDALAETEDRSIAKATSFPICFRYRATLRPENFKDRRLIQWYYKHIGGVVVGSIPEVTNLVVNNRTLPEIWPTIQSDPSYYAACTFGVIECVHEVHSDGSRIVQSKDFKAVL